MIVPQVIRGFLSCWEPQGPASCHVQCEDSGMGGYVPVQTEVNACNSAGVRYLHLIKCPCKCVHIT